MDMLETVGSGNHVQPEAFIVFIVYRDNTQFISKKPLSPAYGIVAFPSKVNSPPLSGSCLPWRL